METKTPDSTLTDTADSVVWISTAWSTSDAKSGRSRPFSLALLPGIFMSALVPVPRSVHAVVFSGLVLALLFVWIGVAEGVRRPITKTILWIRDLLAGSTRQLR